MVYDNGVNDRSNVTVELPPTSSQSTDTRLTNPPNVDTVEIDLTSVIRSKNLVRLTNIPKYRSKFTYESSISMISPPDTINIATMSTEHINDVQMI